MREGLFNPSIALIISDIPHFLGKSLLKRPPSEVEIQSKKCEENKQTQDHRNEYASTRCESNRDMQCHCLVRYGRLITFHYGNDVELHVLPRVKMRKEHVVTIYIFIDSEYLLRLSYAKALDGTH